MSPDDNNDRKAKDVLEGELDSATRADLERWFGLPSFEDAPEAVPEEDPEIALVRERREKAIAAVEPWMIEAHRRRTDPPADLFKFVPNIEVNVDPSIAMLDFTMIDRAGSIA